MPNLIWATCTATFHCNFVECESNLIHSVIHLFVHSFTIQQQTGTFFVLWRLYIFPIPIWIVNSISTVYLTVLILFTSNPSQCQLKIYWKIVRKSLIHRQRNTLEVIKGATLQLAACLLLVIFARFVYLFLQANDIMTTIEVCEDDTAFYHLSVWTWAFKMLKMDSFTVRC